MIPIVDGLEAEFSGTISVIRLDAQEAENAALQARYGLVGHPAFAILDGDGRIAQSFFGPQTAATLRGAMTAVEVD